MISKLRHRSGPICKVSICLLLAGCPAGPSTPAPGTPKPQQGTGNPPKHPDFLDGPKLSEKQFTPEQMAEREKKKNQMIYLMDMTTAPPLEAVAMLETAMQAEATSPGEYGEQMLRHQSIRIFSQLMGEDILDDALARAILRLGEPLRQSGVLPLTHVVPAMVRSHDHLGEPEKGDAIVDATFDDARKARQVASAPPKGSDTGSLTAPPGAPPPSPPARASSVTVTARASGPGAGSPRVIVGAENLPAIRNHEWHWILEFKAMRLAKRDFPAADALLEAECRTARDAMMAQPDAVKPVRDWLSLADLRARVARSSGRTDLADEINKEREETVRKAVEAHPDSAEHFAMSLSMRNDEVGRLSRHDPKGARERFTEIRSSVEGSRFADDPAVVHYKKSWDVYDRMIARSQFHHDLIGRPAPPFDAQRWVHGGPLPLEDLKGRVTVVVFCQINLAKCVELYPWLNGMHDEWHDRGLEVIQVVRQTGLTWNATSKRAETFRQRISLKKTPPKIPDVTAPVATPSDPLAADRPVVAVEARPAASVKAPPDPAAATDAAVQMLEQLATHYGHRFPTMLVPLKTTMHDAYGAEGVPYLVVIDRKGLIQMFENVLDASGRQSVRERVDRLLAE